MSLEATLADEIVEYLVGLDDAHVEEFVVHFDLDCAAERSVRGLASTLGNSGFECRVTEAAHGWRCVASVACVADFDVILRDCRRFSVLVDEFDCEFKGFRIAMYRTASAAEPQETDGEEMDEDEITRELTAILRACPGLARICDFDRAMEQFHDGQYELAFQALWKLCDVEPTEQCNYLPIMATCYLHQQKYAEAANLYEHALVLLAEPQGDPAIRLETLVNLGTCYRYLDQPERAGKVFETAVRDDFFCASAHFQWARLLSVQGDVDQSLRHLREAILGDFTFIELARTECDFAQLREHSEFRALQ